MACYCTEPSIEKRIERAYFIYLGKIIKSEQGKDGVITHNLKIIDTYRGVISSSTLTSKRLETDICGISVAVGDRIVVFGEYEGKNSISSCSDTQHLHHFGKEGLDKLESLKKVKFNTGGS